MMKFNLTVEDKKMLIEALFRKLNDIGYGYISYSNRKIKDLVPEIDCILTKLKLLSIEE